MNETSGATGAGPETPQAHRQRAPWWIWVLLLVAAVIVVGGLTQFFATVEEPEDTLRVENRTNETIVIYHRLADGSETPSHIFPEIEAGSSFTVYLTCGDGSLAARTEDGELVDTRGPFEECNLEDWIIEAPGG